MKEENKQVRTLQEFRAHIRSVVSICCHLVKRNPASRSVVKTAAPVIVTKFVYPPIPTDACDWVAYYADEVELRNFGWGPTEQAAIEDLKASYYPEGRE